MDEKIKETETQEEGYLRIEQQNVKFGNLVYKVQMHLNVEKKARKRNLQGLICCTKNETCYIKWKIETADETKIEKIVPELEMAANYMEAPFRIEFVHIGSLILGTTVKSQILQNNKVLRRAVKKFLKEIQFFGEINTNYKVVLKAEAFQLDKEKFFMTEMTTQIGWDSNITPWHRNCNKTSTSLMNSASTTPLWNFETTSGVYYHDHGILRYVSITTSFLGLAWSLNAFKHQHRKKELEEDDSMSVKLVHWISRFAEILPRIILIALVAAEYIERQNNYQDRQQPLDKENSQLGNSLDFRNERPNYSNRFERYLLGEQQTNNQDRQQPIEINNGQLENHNNYDVREGRQKLQRYERYNQTEEQYSGEPQTNNQYLKQSLDYDYGQLVNTFDLRDKRPNNSQFLGYERSYQRGHRYLGVQNNGFESHGITDKRSRSTNLYSGERQNVGQISNQNTTQMHTRGNNYSQHGWYNDPSTSIGWPAAANNHKSNFASRFHNQSFVGNEGRVNSVGQYDSHEKHALSGY
ncbi:Hypothetical predicted protein [Mytilus galloprovincialis]|uniref:Uncharacterized protein n=1 Tax=Mytilus galloprovincialis TaxID=29158 RepID=A0A8B6CZY0_MYTGA|nr:Hypothetical predicted protein [Mytilus galloprovincialis]